MQAILIISFCHILILLIFFISLKKEIRKIQKLISKHHENHPKAISISKPIEDDSFVSIPPKPKIVNKNIREYSKAKTDNLILNEAIVSICKNIASKKYFIHLDDVDRLKSKMINPEGKIIILSNDLFDEIEEERLSILIGTNRLSEKQIQALKLINSEVKLTSPKEEKLGNRELGSKGNENLKDYLIPVLQLIYEGYDYKEAFHIVKDHLDVRYNTVSAQCTRALGLTTDEFVIMAKDKSIIQILKQKYSDRIDLIERELFSTTFD